MGKLKGMAVERVDGVDRPAIRKRFVLVKREDAEAETVEKDYAGASRAVIEALAKETGVSFSEETVDVLKALVELLELDIDFAAKSEESDETEETEESGEEETETEEDEAETETEDEAVEKTYSADEVEGLLAKFAAANGITIEKSADEDDTRPLRVAKSRQPRSQEDADGKRRTVKKGEGMFRGVVFANPTEPFKAR